MPELPEVETTVRQLKNNRAHKILGARFLDVWSDFPKMIKQPKSFEEFKKRIKGKKIEKIYRKGKNIIFDLSKGFALLVHQKLTGHLLYGEWKKTKTGWQAKNNTALKDDSKNRFLHLIFWLDNKKQLALSDLRKFAKVELAKKEEIEKELRDLGPDPLVISLEEFKKRLENKKAGIKQVLMDQQTISGVGNIYSDEVLFAAKIHPLKRVFEMTKNNFQKLYSTLRKILREAIKLQGTSVSDYRNIEGKRGKFNALLKVYQREGQKCLRCGAVIERLKISGRSAHYCPKCQK